LNAKSAIANRTAAIKKTASQGGPFIVVPAGPRLMLAPL
jgi:hypothetical protein